MQWVASWNAHPGYRLPQRRFPFPFFLKLVYCPLGTSRDFEAYATLSHVLAAPPDNILITGVPAAEDCDAENLLEREGWSDYVFAFHDREEVGPRMLARISKHTGLRPEDM